MSDDNNKKNKTIISVTLESAIVTGLTSEGWGLLPDGIKLPYCLPDEMVSYEKVVRTRRRKHYYLKNIIKTSSRRQEPICPHFKKCGGCTLQHLDSELYKTFKLDMVNKFLMQNNIPYQIDSEPVIIPPGHRRRTNMDIRKRDDIVFLGYHGLQSFYVTNIDPCPILDKAIERLLDPLGNAMKLILDNGQNAKIFILLSDTGLDLSLEIQHVRQLSDDQRQVLIDFAKQHNLCRLRFRYCKNFEDLLIREMPYVLIDSIPVTVDPWSFLQSSKIAQDILSNWVIDAMPNNCKHVIDIFCGRGTFTLPMSNIAKITGYEYDQLALNSLNTANKNYCNRTITLHQRDLMINPLTMSELAEADMVVINPPRAGAKAQCSELAQSHIARIAYVSCNPETFALDAANLIKGGYKIDYIKILDQFVYTPHLEVFGVFSK